MRPVFLPHMLLLVGMGCALAQTMSEPEALKRAEKYADQVVRVIPQRVDGIQAETGFGLMVGQSAGKVYVATPYHVAFGKERPSALNATPGIIFRQQRYTTIQARRLDRASPNDDLAVIEVAPPLGLTPPQAPLVLAMQIQRGEWVWNIGIGEDWDMPDRAGGFGTEEPISRWRRVGALRTPPGAPGGAGVTSNGVVGIVLQDAGDYSLLLPAERIIQLFTAWGLPVNLLRSSVVPPNAAGPCGDKVVASSLTSRCPLTTAEEQALRPRDRFGECESCPEMVVVPAGTFTMGSASDEPGRNSDETQIRISFPKSFAVGRFAVTFQEWDACTTDGGCKYVPEDNGWGRGKRPVINVNWDDARAYVAWLSRKTGKAYRLPTETEREYFTRAGTTGPFWWGSSISPKQANYNGTADPYQGGGSKGEFRQHTLAVSTFQPNPWDLFNVHGNVWEWTEDCWGETNAGVPKNGSARLEGDCDKRVTRGGSWIDPPSILRSALRHWDYSVNRYTNHGFRVVRSF